MTAHDSAPTRGQTLARVRSEAPDSFAALKAILDAHRGPLGGDAFFPVDTDDSLSLALQDAGWEIRLNEDDRVYMARHPLSGAKLHYVEGHLYDRTHVAPTRVGARVVLVSSADRATRLVPGSVGTIVQRDDAGTVHVRWDGDGTLGLVSGADRWRLLHPRDAVCSRCHRLLSPGCCDITGFTRTNDGHGS